MVRRWARLKIVSLLLLLIVPAAFAAESFPECFPAQPLDRFWLYPTYLDSNPSILDMGVFKFYSFHFDGSLQGLGIQNVSLCGPACLESHASPSELSALSGASASLSKAQQSLSEAKESQATAHALSSRAKSALQNILSISAYDAVFGVVPVFSSEAFKLAASSLDFMNYALDYEVAYGQALSSSSDAYEAANNANSALARLADTELSSLSKAGAASPQYSGAAKVEYYRTQSLLSSTAFCSRAKADRIGEYFASHPANPDFSSVSFAPFLQSSSGEQENSSLLLLLGAYEGMKAAHSAMLQEHASEYRLAENSSFQLSLSVSYLASQSLELIDTYPSQPSDNGTIKIGASFSGLYDGLREAKAAQARITRELAESARLKNSPTEDNYLANAIAAAQAARLEAESATGSAALVRANAEAAVQVERVLAEQEISSASAKVGAPSSFTDAAALESASRKLREASAAFDAASMQPTLGARFSGYKNARQLAQAAQAALDSRVYSSLRDGAENELGRLDSLLRLASGDGLDVSYEKGRAEEYRALLSSATLPGTCQPIIDAAQSDSAGILQRLYEKYSYLEGDYSQASSMVDGIRQMQPYFLSPSFDSLQAYFPGGKLDAARAAGHLGAISQGISGAISQSQSKMPDYLSYVLSSHARAQELVSPPTLGRAGNYSLSIITSNPTPFSYSGPVGFSAPATVAVYSSDFASGDTLVDAYYESGKVKIAVNGVGAGQTLHFAFARIDQPAQVSSSEESCTSVSQDSAEVSRTVGFFASRALPSLLVSEPVPEGARNGRVRYSGATTALQSGYSGAQPALEGGLGPVPAGKGAVAISYSVAQPYSVSFSPRSYETLAGGAKKTSYEVTVSGPKLDCASASVELVEPFASSSFSVVPLGGHAVQSQKSISAGSATHASFSFSPLRKGQDASFMVSFTVQNSSQALSDALLLAELQISLYNRTRDISALSQAKLLASQNRTDDALSLLATVQQEGRALSLTGLDLNDYNSAKSGMESQLASLQEAQKELIYSNLTSESAALSPLADKLRSSLQSASSTADSEGYTKALSLARKAESDFRASLSQLAWKAASGAADSYAKAAKQVSGDGTGLADAQQEISLANRLYAEGDYLQSYLASAHASGIIASALQHYASSAADDASEAEKIRSDYNSLKPQVESLLSAFSSQYSSLSSSGKKQLSLAPSEAQKRMDDADKGISASAKSTLSGSEQLSMANASYQKLLALQSTVSAALSSLQSSAESSLRVANVALSEVQSRASPDDGDASQIQSEVSRAEDFYANALYSDSLLSSDRAIKAANAFLAKKAAGGIDSKAIALGAVSVLFIAAAAWFFLKGGKKPEALKEKKSLPKEE
ncbi:Uncharacterised protein [uncultured archaeon]|nr:Uncharacterised protein [uncultured archaeon]